MRGLSIHEIEVRAKLVGEFPVGGGSFAPFVF